MDNKLEKPSDILTVKEAIKLIDSDTPDHPVVNNVKLIKGIEYLRANWRGGHMNYTIHLVKRDKKGKIVPNGVKFVSIDSQREQRDLEYAITDHYKDRSGREIDPDMIGIVRQTTVVNESDGNVSGRPRKNTSGKAIKKGDKLITGSGTATSEEA